MAPFQCGVCAREFKNRPLIFNHALDTGHNVNQCCRVCSRWFCSESGLAAHKLSPVHIKNVAKTSKPGITYDVNRHCEVCVRWFNNEYDLAADKGSRGHIKKVTKLSKPANTSASKSDQSSKNIPPVVDLRFGDGTYTCLAPQQQDTILDQLSASCHSKESLVKERYMLDAVKGPTAKLTRPKPSLAEFQHTPVMQSAVIKRRAVVIDCKMAKAIDGSDELISLCAIDFLTGDTLIDLFVSPLRRITDWRTKVHGIDAAVIMEAVRHQKNLHGWAAARGELWKHIDDNTILIGQKILFDFEALRLIHMHVVDLGMLTREAVFKKKKPSRWWGLGEICETFLGVKIRGDGICNKIEDIRASREVVLHYLLRPDDFKKWADKAREDFWKPKARSKNLKKNLKKKGTPKHITPQSAEQEVSAFDPFEEYDGCYDSLDDDDFYDHHFDQLFQHEQDVFVKLGVDTAYL